MVVFDVCLSVGGGVSTPAYVPRKNEECVRTQEGGDCGSFADWMTDMKAPCVGQDDVFFHTNQDTKENFSPRPEFRRILLV